MPSSCIFQYKLNVLSYTNVTETIKRLLKRLIKKNVKKSYLI